MLKGTFSHRARSTWRGEQQMNGNRHKDLCRRFHRQSPHMQRSPEYARANAATTCCCHQRQYGHCKPPHMPLACILLPYHICSLQLYSAGIFYPAHHCQNLHDRTGDCRLSARSPQQSVFSPHYWEMPHRKSHCSAIYAVCRIPMWCMSILYYTPDSPKHIG